MSQPDNKSRQYQAMEPHWALPDALMGGTNAMRGSLSLKGRPGSQFLPAHEGESVERYNARARMTFLRNFYKKTLKQLVGRLLQEGVKADADVPGALAAILGDVDLCGNDVSVFAAHLAECAIHKGGAFVLVDAQDAAAENLGDQVRVGIRPYLVSYDLSDVLGVRYDIVGGQEVITQARIRRTREVADGDFGAREVEEIVVYEPDRIRVYTKAKSGWELTEDRANPAGVVTLVAIGLNPVGPFEYRPALETLAEMNLEHFQIRSDQRNALAVSSFPIPCASGWDADKDSAIVFGPYNMLATSDPQGKFYYLESNGTAVAAGQKELDALEDRMTHFGLQFQAEKVMTATEAGNEHERATSELADWGNRIAYGLTQALHFMALRLGLPQEGKLTIEPPDPVRQAVVQEADVLLKSRMAGEISRREYRIEIKRLGVAGEQFDPEAEVEDEQDFGDTPPEAPPPSNSRLIELAERALGNAGG